MTGGRRGVNNYNYSDGLDEVKEAAFYYFRPMHTPTHI